MRSRVTLSLIAAGLCLGFAQSALADGMTSEVGSLPIGAGNRSYYIVVGPGDLISIVDPQATPPSSNPAWVAAHQTAWINAHTGQTSWIPTGAVMAFNLPSCPSGWSPFANAVGRDIIGAGSYSEVTAGSVNVPYNASYNVGDMGGNAMVSLNTNQMPKHSHDARMTGQPDDHYLNSLDTEDIARTGVIEFDYLDANAGNVNIVEPFQATAPGHSLLGARGDNSGPFISNGLTGGDPTMTEGQAAPLDNRQPYLALLYCQKD